MKETADSIHPTRWRWIAAIWLAGGLFDASQNVMIMHREGKHHWWVPLFLTELALWLPWALATPFISRLARRHMTGRGVTPRAIAEHLATFCTVTVVAEAWSALLQVLFNPWANRRPPEFLGTFGTSLLYQVLTFVIVYALILTVTFLLDSRDRMSRQFAEAARLNAELSKAQLAALRRQMEPHFMFNTLNAIAALVRDRRNEAAVSTIVGLSEFLRRVAADSDRTQVALAEEVEYLQRYVDLQKVRFGERLQVSVNIPTDLQRALVPMLLLQPLVENAIKHGISKRAVGGAVRVAASRQGNVLCLTVYNDGPPPSPDWQASPQGVGIANLRTRLQILHGNQSDLQMRSAQADGVEVAVTLPFRQS
ncbi:MAG: histidine kinase [Proteobacteria bacterium]|nr:histidine kinase [Pseudomonadota bacterium]